MSVLEIAQLASAAAGLQAGRIHIVKAFVVKVRVSLSHDLKKQSIDVLAPISYACVFDELVGPDLAAGIRGGHVIAMSYQDSITAQKRNIEFQYH